MARVMLESSYTSFYMTEMMADFCKGIKPTELLKPRLYHNRHHQIDILYDLLWKLYWACTYI